MPAKATSERRMLAQMLHVPADLLGHLFSLGSPDLGKSRGLTQPGQRLGRKTPQVGLVADAVSFVIFPGILPQIFPQPPFERRTLVIPASEEWLDQAGMKPDRRPFQFRQSPKEDFVANDGWQADPVASTPPAIRIQKFEGGEAEALVAAAHLMGRQGNASPGTEIENGTPLRKTGRVERVGDHSLGSEDFIEHGQSRRIVHQVGA